MMAFSVGIAAWSGNVFRLRMKYFESGFVQLLTAPESDLPEKTESLAADWEKYADFLRSFLIHDGVDELEILITSLPETLKYSGVDEVKEKCIEGINLVRNLKSCEKLSLENIF